MENLESNSIAKDYKELALTRRINALLDDPPEDEEALKEFNRKYMEEIREKERRLLTCLQITRQCFEDRYVREAAEMTKLISLHDNEKKIKTRSLSVD